MSEFEVLGLAPKFNLDSAELENAYFAAQRQWHPDRFVTKSADEKAEAAVKSTQVNDAYQTLKDPLLRARALYVVLVGALPDSSQSETLLQDMMALQEKLMEDPDAAKKEVKQQLDDCERDLVEAFANRLEDIPELVERYAYLVRLKG